MGDVDASKLGGAHHVRDNRDETNGIASDERSNPSRIVNIQLRIPPTPMDVRAVFD